jgi:adenylate kinase family enzyme
VNRILIIGPCGAGKSTLATHLGRRFALPVFHMDQLNWNAGWIESSGDEIRSKLRDITCGDRWLIDGTYGGTLGDRLPYADTILYLDYPIGLCLWRLLRRIVRFHGRTRPDMTAGCPERFDFPFLLYLLRWNSGPRLRTEQRLRGFEDKVIRFKSPHALDQWLQSLAQN